MVSAKIWGDLPHIISFKKNESYIKKWEQSYICLHDKKINKKT
jgi:hypothetical protein